MEYWTAVSPMFLPEYRQGGGEDDGVDEGGVRGEGGTTLNQEDHYIFFL